METETWSTSHILTTAAPFAVIPVLGSSVIGACIFGLLIGSVLGYLCRLQVNKTSSKETGPVVPSPSHNFPVYEDVELNETAAIKVSQNVAYGEVSQAVVI